MRYLSLPEILEIHDKIIEVSGGARGIRDMRALESSINQPRIQSNRPLSGRHIKSSSTLFFYRHESSIC